MRLSNTFCPRFHSITPPIFMQIAISCKPTVPKLQVSVRRRCRPHQRDRFRAPPPPSLPQHTARRLTPQRRGHIPAVVAHSRTPRDAIPLARRRVATPCPRAHRRVHASPARFAVRLHARTHPRSAPTDCTRPSCASPPPHPPTPVLCTSSLVGGSRGASHHCSTADGDLSVVQVSHRVVVLSCLLGLGLAALILPILPSHLAHHA